MRGVGLRAAVSGLARGARRVRVRAVAAIVDEKDYTDSVVLVLVLGMIITQASAYDLMGRERRRVEKLPCPEVG